MKKSLFAVLAFVFGCNGSVSLEDSSGTTSGSGTTTVASSSSSGSSSSSSGAGGSMSSSSSSSSSSGVGGSGGSSSELAVIFEGPSTAWSVQACATGAPPMQYSLVTHSHEIEIDQQHFLLESTDSGRLVGSNGTHYFTNIRVMKGAVTAMGPLEIPLLGASPATTVQFNFTDAFTLMPATDTLLMFSMNVSCTEDSPGEFFGHSYRVHWLPMVAGDAKDLTTSTALDPSEISPNSEMIGSSFSIYM